MAALLAPLALALVVAGARNAPASPDRFSIVIEPRSTGWSAHCELGCAPAWTASFACPTACDARVDAVGIVTLAETRPADPRFSFTVERTADGVSATSKTGTLWTALSWRCPGERCRVRLTESGVSFVEH
jgi:hypothetical protein